MANVFVYSFEDTSVVISHPSVGMYSAYGTGIGSVSVSMSEDASSHQVAADLAVVVSKHVKKNGVVGFDVLQSSDFNNFLNKLYNYLATAAPSEFALTQVIIDNKGTGRHYVCTGVTPQKLPDDQYQSQSTNRGWQWLAANIETQ